MQINPKHGTARLGYQQGGWYITQINVMVWGSRKYANRAAALLDLRAHGYDADANGDVFSTRRKEAS